jgi:hypothetical protein
VKDWTEARPYLHAVVEHLRVRADNAEAQRWLALIRGARYGEQLAGGLSGWANKNDSQWVETLQAEFDNEQHMRKMWMPGTRNAVWNPFGIRFFQDLTSASDRLFRGVLTLGSNDTTYVGYDRNNWQVMVYHVVEKV